MKFLLIATCLVLCVACTCAQRCNGLPNGRLKCDGRDEGVRQQRGCTPSPNNEMWYYIRRSNDCFKLRYLGCGGNQNRYCTKAACMQRCYNRI